MCYMLRFHEIHNLFIYTYIVEYRGKVFIHIYIHICVYIGVCVCIYK